MVMIFPELLSDQVGPVNVNAESFGKMANIVFMGIVQAVAF